MNTAKDILDVRGEKARLKKKLNDGKFNLLEWRDFIAFAEAAGCLAMAEDMRGRARFYAQVIDSRRADVVQ